MSRLGCQLSECREKEECLVSKDFYDEVFCHDLTRAQLDKVNRLNQKLVQEVKILKQLLKDNNVDLPKL